jgi:hypothetical protein
MIRRTMSHSRLADPAREAELHRRVECPSGGAGTPFSVMHCAAARSAVDAPGAQATTADISAAPTAATTAVRISERITLSPCRSVVSAKV